MYVVQIGVDVEQEDVALLVSDTGSDHLNFMTSEARRNTEVVISKLTAEDKKMFEQAKQK